MSDRMVLQYIGGESLTIGERQQRYGVKLRAAPIFRQGDWKDQCFCGSNVIVRYRGRLYCQRCGLRRCRSEWPR